MEKTVGQVAYEAWVSRVMDDVAWSILPDSTHTRWEEIAKEVINYALLAKIQSSEIPTTRIEIPASMKPLFD